MHRLSTLLLIVVAWPLSAQHVRDFPAISTSGSAEIKVTPDIIEIAVGIETIGDDLVKAKGDNDAATARVLAAAKARIVDPAKIQTDYLSIDPEDMWESSRRVRKYAVRRSIAIEMNDLAGFEPLISALIEAGANHVHSVHFKTSQLRKYRDEARRLATKAAHEKAKLLAESLGRTVGKVHSIQEGYDNWWSSYSSWWGSRWPSGSQNTMQVANSGTAPAASEGSLAPGRISVTASVNVTFLLE